MPDRALYLAAYDVTNADRLQAALRVLKGYASGGQKSVFECFLTARERTAMLVGAGHGDARRRLGQYRLALDAGARLVLARRLIAAKLRAQIRLLDAALERRPDARKPLHDALDTLRRLARVISQGPVDWHCEALLGCAEAGVPVVFLRGDGAVRAYAFGGRRLGRDPHDLLYTRLRARLARPGGMARYGAWRDAMMQVALRVLHRRLGDALTDCRADGPALGFAAIWSGVAGAQECASIERRLHGLLAGLSAQLLAEAGLDAARWCKLDFEFDLAGDLAALLGWALAEPVFLTLRDRAGGVSVLDLNDQRQLIALFEIHAEDLRRLGRRWLHQLRQWLETCEPWREGGGFI